MNMHQAQKVRCQLEDAIAAVERELTEIANGKPSVSATSELDFIRSSLREMLESLKFGDKLDIPGLWRIVTDTWPHTSELRKLIVEAELSYERLK